MLTRQSQCLIRLLLRDSRRNKDAEESIKIDYINSTMVDEQVTKMSQKNQIKKLAAKGTARSLDRLFDGAVDLDDWDREVEGHAGGGIDDDGDQVEGCVRGTFYV